jgi:ribosomal protein L20A (L18A)
MDIYPELSAGFGKSEQDREDMEEALKVCWAAIPKETFDKLYQSMGNRIEACIAVNGWHTKY